MVSRFHRAARVVVPLACWALMFAGLKRVGHSEEAHLAQLAAEKAPIVATGVTTHEADELLYLGDHHYSPAKMIAWNHMREHVIRHLDSALVAAPHDTASARALAQIRAYEAQADSIVNLQDIPAHPHL
jgi:hypothetical protein